MLKDMMPELYPERNEPNVEKTQYRYTKVSAMVFSGHRKHLLKIERADDQSISTISEPLAGTQLLNSPRISCI